MKHLLPIRLTVTLLLGLFVAACGDQSEPSAKADSAKVAEDKVGEVASAAQSETARLNEWFEVKYEEELMTKL